MFLLDIYSFVRRNYETGMSNMSTTVVESSTVISKVVFCRPISCTHDSDIEIFDAELEFPQFSCGCTAVILPDERIFKNVDALKCNEILSIDTFIDEVHQSLQRDVVLVHRLNMARCLSEPFILSLTSFVTPEPMSWVEFVNDFRETRDSVMVEIDWVLMKLATEPIADGFYQPNYFVLCNNCHRRNFIGVFAEVEVLDASEVVLNLEMSAEGDVIVPCDYLPKHSLFLHTNLVLAAKFAVIGGERHTYCNNCLRKICRVVDPNPDTVRFRHTTPSSYVGNDFMNIRESDLPRILS